VGRHYRRADASAHHTNNGGDIHTNNLALYLTLAIRVFLLLNLLDSTSYSNRYTPSHPYIRLICYRAIYRLYELPVDRDEYSGLHPA
jgi:hypothetical protein